MEQPERCKLGDVVTHRIHGMEGVVSGITHYLNGCVSCGVIPTTLKDGKPQDWYWADQIEWLVKEPAKFAPPDRVPGGPMPTPPEIAGAER